MANEPSKTAGVIRFTCRRCQSKLKVADKFADRYISCPECKQRIPVPKDQQEADEEARNYEVKKLLYAVPKKCMKCNTRMCKGAVVCTKCGFDYREGSHLQLEDYTIGASEERRGKPAIQYFIVECVVIVILIGLALYRGLSAKIIWWEIGCYISGALTMLSMLPGHLIQYANYSNVPRRPGPMILEEDRAEREEARAPYGGYTALAVVFCILIGFGIALPTWGEGDWTKTRDWTKSSATDVWQWIFGKPKPAETNAPPVPGQN